MVTFEQAKIMALSFEGTDERPHFNRTAFTVKKKIFATLSIHDKTLNLMFSPQQQVMFCPPESKLIFPIPNGWGTNGWTTIDLSKASKKLVQSALEAAYNYRKEK